MQASVDSQLPFEQLGRYQLLAPLGVGGMGRVFEARLTGPGQATKFVALKLIHSNLAGHPEFVLMFLEEVRIAMALTHRNIVQTFDSGEVDGQYYLVMELVRGYSLRQLTRHHEQQDPLPIEIAVFIMMEVCAALEYAHNYEPEHTGHPGRVLHCDVSPGNILLSTHGEVKLTDFGVAKAAGCLAAGEDSIKGKLAYMAPEQARGEEGTPSDIFSVGAVLFELLTRRRIRERLTPEAVKRGELAIGTLRQLRPDTPASLEELLISCLANDPADRPQSADSLRTALAAELFKLHADVGPPPDFHAGLRSFLRRRDGHGDSTARVSSAKRIEKIMLEQALCLKTVVGKLGGGTASSHDARPPTADTTKMDPGAFAGIEVPTEASLAPSRDPSSRRMLLALTIVLAFLAAGTIAVYLMIGNGDGGNGGNGGDGDALARRAAVAPSARVNSGVPASRPHKGPSLLAVDAGLAVGRRTGRVKRVRPRTSKRSRRGARKNRTHTPQRGRLNLNAIPWARVYIDGRYRGNTPIQKLALKPGKYRVRLVNPPNRLSTRLTLTIRANRTLVRVINLRHTL